MQKNPAELMEALTESLACSAEDQFPPPTLTMEEMRRMLELVDRLSEPDNVAGSSV